MRWIRHYGFAGICVSVSVLALAFLYIRSSPFSIATAGRAEFGHIIVIDAGHGGEDGGAVAPDGMPESSLNLSIAHRLNDFLHLLGAETRMLRTDDSALYSPEAETISEKKVSDLKNRVKAVNETPEAILISIHQNMFAEAKYDGLQIFYAPTESSRLLAESMQSLFVRAVDPGNHRLAKPADSVYLMQNIECTGVLVECGFLSNENEYNLLRTDIYQKKIAITLANGLCDFRKKVNTNEI
ncbi:MAG: N-acetylmuramoyl-L-alanine amidase [Oscillospiraceae bacterium]|nr:N-acetylmuramoyl-L-alanine amidase [Oscillospiraceae bacterium]